MENEEKLKINIYPSELEIQKDNKEKTILKISENFTNDSKPKKFTKIYWPKMLQYKIY